jgi:hypothetical protein
MIEFELEDIFEDISKDWQKVISENIEYVLRREKLWGKNYSICFPIGAINDINCDDEIYQFDFEIFSNLNTVIGSGTSYGKGMNFKDTFEIVDMTVEVCEEFGKPKMKGFVFR